MRKAERDPSRPSWVWFQNTYLQGPKWLFTAVVRQRDYDAALSPQITPSPTGRGYVDRVLQRSFWFWPRVTGAERWANSTTERGWDPQQYLHTEPTRLLNALMERVPREASVLDLGCNSGSDVDILARAGYTNLSAMDAGGAALDLFKETYPDTFAKVDVQRDLFQRYLLQSGDDRFDAIYSNGATIELLHPSFPVVRELCRVARHWVLLDLDEGQGYPRNFVAQFARHGFRLDYLWRDPRENPSSVVLVFVSTRP